MVGWPVTSGEIKSAIDAHLSACRPLVVAALWRRFKDLPFAEYGSQSAALKALNIWTRDGVPRNPAGWLIRVGLNALVDMLRKDGRLVELTETEGITEQLEAGTPEFEEEIDRTAFQDDLLRVLFFCCHPELVASDQMTLSLRYVLGLSVSDIARAFVVSADTLQRRISRARNRSEKIGFADAGEVAPAQRAGQIAQIRASLYLMFNKGYAASHSAAPVVP